jgi:hypothetical protein
MTYTYTSELKTTAGNTLTNVLYVDRVTGTLEGIEIYGDFHRTEHLDSYTIPNSVFDAKVDKVPLQLTTLGTDETDVIFSVIKRGATSSADDGTLLTVDNLYIENLSEKKFDGVWKEFVADLVATA